MTTKFVDTNLPPALNLNDQTAPTIPSNQGKKPLRLGLILGVEPDPDAAMATLKSLGLPTCQVYLNKFDPAFAAWRMSASADARTKALATVTNGPNWQI